MSHKSDNIKICVLISVIDVNIHTHIIHTQSDSSSGSDSSSSDSSDSESTLGSSDENFSEQVQRNRFASSQHPPVVRHLTLNDDHPPQELASGNKCGESGIPLVMPNTAVKPGKEVKAQKKQPKKEKLANYGIRGEERPTLAIKKPPPAKRSKSAGRHNSQAPQSSGHAHDKIQSLDGLFGE